MKKLNWGIIGCGEVTEQKSGPAFYTLPHTSLKAVMRRDAIKAADYAKRHHVPAFYTDVEALLQDSRVEAVYVATPPNMHAEYTIKALEAGKPVYVEKPMAVTESECRMILDASKRTGQPVYVAYYRREMAYFRKIKDLLDRRVIGEIILADIRLYRSPLTIDKQADKPWRLKAEISGGGYFLDMATHQLDLLLWFFGQLDHVSGVATNRAGLYSVEDTVQANFRFKSGVIASGQWCFVVPENNVEDRFEIVGTKGSLSFSTFTMTPICLKINGLEEFFSISKPEIVEKEMISHVSDQILQGETDQQALFDAVEVTRITDQILQNYRESLL